MAKKILIVDDEPDVVSYLTAFLEDNGFETVAAVNGRDCYEKAKSEKPDLITLDITMPEESGVKAFRNIQNDPDTKHIPIIIVTGVATEFKDFISTRKQVPPPAGYFEKPIDRDDFLAKVKEILKIS
jgi:CheY-like chemotaxis protein